MPVDVIFWIHGFKLVFFAPRGLAVRGSGFTSACQWMELSVNQWKMIVLKARISNYPTEIIHSFIYSFIHSLPLFPLTSWDYWRQLSLNPPTTGKAVSVSCFQSCWGLERWGGCMCFTYVSHEYLMYTRSYFLEAPHPGLSNFNSKSPKSLEIPACQTNGDSWSSYPNHMSLGDVLSFTTQQLCAFLPPFSMEGPLVCVRWFLLVFLISFVSQASGMGMVAASHPPPMLRLKLMMGLLLAPCSGSLLAHHEVFLLPCQ